MKATEVLAGMKFEFTITGNVFEISNVTDKRISWHTQPHKSHYGINTIKKVWVSMRQFQEAIDKNVYILKNK